MVVVETATKPSRLERFFQTVPWHSLSPLPFPTAGSPNRFLSGLRLRGRLPACPPSGAGARPYRPSNPHVLLTCDKVHNPLRLPHKTTSERQKAVRSLQFLTLLTWKCASRHNGVHFFFQKWSEHGVLCTF